MPLPGQHRIHRRQQLGRNLALAHEACGSSIKRRLGDARLVVRTEHDDARFRPPGQQSPQPAKTLALRQGEIGLELCHDPVVRIVVGVFAMRPIAR